MDALVPMLSVAPRTRGDGKQTVTLYTGRDNIRALMKAFCINDKQKALEAKRSVDIEAFKDKVDPMKVAVRPGYLNAVLIQSRGRTGMVCDQCAQNPDRGPFTDCRRAAGHFDGACGNCKWRDHGARCSLNNPNEPDDGWEHPQRVEGVVGGQVVEIIQLDSE